MLTSSLGVEEDGDEHVAHDVHVGAARTMIPSAVMLSGDGARRTWSDGPARDPPCLCDCLALPSVEVVDLVDEGTVLSERESRTSADVYNTRSISASIPAISGCCRICAMRSSASLINRPKQSRIVFMRNAWDGEMLGCSNNTPLTFDGRLPVVL